MMYSEYQNWVKRNTPPLMPDHDFREFLALIGAMTVQQNLDDREITMEELIVTFFDGEKVKS